MSIKKEKRNREGWEIKGQAEQMDFVNLFAIKIF